jgi:hypothetical protein
MTAAILEEPGQPPLVLHFGIPMSSPHVKVLDTWRAHGMLAAQHRKKADQFSQPGGQGLGEPLEVATLPIHLR